LSGERASQEAKQGNPPLLAVIMHSAYPSAAFLVLNPNAETDSMATRKKRAAAKKMSKQDIRLAKRIEKIVIAEMIKLIEKKRLARKPALKAAKKAIRKKGKPTKKTTKKVIRHTARKVVRKTAGRIAKRVRRKS
jgi:predicted sugar kinase